MNDGAVIHECDAIIDDIRKAVREEVRSELLLHGPQIGELPLPSDIEAERIVVKSVCLGHATVRSLHLHPGMFFAPLHSAILTAAESSEPRHPASIVRTMGDNGIANPARFSDDVAAFFDDFNDPPESVYPAATKVQRAFRARETCKLMSSLNRRLRLGEITPEQVELSFRWLRVSSTEQAAPPAPLDTPAKTR
ncbi:MAG TPA: hypothetical protein VGJ21_05395 [Terracidiphilus sp.]